MSLPGPGQGCQARVRRGQRADGPPPATGSKKDEIKYYVSD